MILEVFSFSPSIPTFRAQRHLYFFGVDYDDAILKLELLLDNTVIILVAGVYLLLGSRLALSL